MSRLERRTVTPTLVRLAELANILSVPIRALLNEASPLTVDVTDEVYKSLAKLGENDRVWTKNMLTELCSKLAVAPQQKRYLVNLDATSRTPQPTQMKAVASGARILLRKGGAVNL
jgi:transcriptional regulator with XRE-family HTH domain